MSILFHTGLRISEFVGLTAKDVDFSEMKIHVTHQLQRKRNMEYIIEDTKITPYVCRHTFCSNMAKSGMNPKTLQYIMGYADIGVTLNTYTHLSFEDAREEMTRFCANE